MHKIMLVDDETTFLNSLVDGVNWSDYGFKTPILSHNGREAIQKVQDGIIPDVVITDICMPFIDGLELTHYLNQNLPETIIVIVSRYDNFKYAQKAVKLNVFDYILKPISKGKLHEVLYKLKNTLDILQIKNSDNHIEIIKNHFLNCLLMKKLEKKYITQNCKTHKIDFNGKYHLVIILDVDYHSPCTVEENNNLQLMRYGLYNISQEIVSNNINAKNIVVFKACDNLTKLIIDSNSVGKCHTIGYKLSELIVSTVSEYLGITVSAGIGEPTTYTQDIYKSHLDATIALNHRFFYGKSSIIFSSDIDNKNCHEIDYTSYKICLMDSIKNLDSKGAKFVIINMITDFKQNHLDISHCVLYSQKLAICIINFTDKIIDNAESNSFKKVWDDFNFYSISTISMLENMLIKICDKSFTLIRSVNNSSSKILVVESQKFINENISDNTLSLIKVAECLNISTSHFTNIFKKHLGVTFNEYLTSQRIEKSKQNLLLTNKPIYQIAQEVGFTNPRYFNVVFKRSVNMTPKQYRNNTLTK